MTATMKVGMAVMPGVWDGSWVRLRVSEATIMMPALDGGVRLCQGCDLSPQAYAAATAERTLAVTLAHFSCGGGGGSSSSSSVM